ncbi:MAG: LytTR family DNA-binding domain-containing protein [Clostridium sp.]|nr:LytTR family DNA-binding domain-containing protein [Clostridium sp.]
MMKLTIEESLDNNEVEITIKCGVMDNRLRRLIETIREYSFSIQCKKNNEIYTIPLEDVYYIESVDKKTFIYCKSEVYETTNTLINLEEKLTNTSFIRISKSCILNISYLQNVTPLWNHRFEATLKNDEKLIITRHYIDELKNKLGL